MNRGKEIESWERERIHIWELHKKPNPKRKRSLLRKHTEEKEEENANNSNESNKLPADIMSCIIKRCTVNTLSMLKCASKSWNDFITSPSFVNSHLKHSTENAQVFFMKHIFPKSPLLRRGRLQFVSVDMEGKGESNKLYTITIPEFSVECSGMIVSSGLVCLSSGYDRFYLYNPVMQQLRKLPKCSHTDLFRPSNFGFGYLHSTKEYKVVNFFYTAQSFFKLRCEVFTFTSLTNGQIWKEIAETPPCHPHSRGFLVNECLYWLGNPEVSATPDQILSFEFENGKFLTISYPPSVRSLSRLCLMDMKGMFCVPNMEHWWTSLILDLWILKDKINCNWVKEYSISFANYGPRVISPIFKAWNEGIIFMCNDVLVFYDLKRNCIRGGSTIGFGVLQGTDILEYGFEIYRKSLFSL